MEARDFITTVFGSAEGFLFISSKSDPVLPDVDVHKAFKYPDSLNTIVKYVEMRTDEDLYFSPMLYSVPRRKAAMVCATPVLYADTDTFDPALYRVQPSLNIISSPGHTQGLWLLDDEYSPAQVEAASRAIALTHASTIDGKQAGTDAGGWDLTQLLRFPNSKNRKYRVLKNGEQAYPDYTEEYDVILGEGSDEVYSLEDITKHYALDAEVTRNAGTVAMPQELPEMVAVLPRIAGSRKLSSLYYTAPRADQDWSDAMYFFVSECLRSGLTAAETLVAAWNAKCNKYERDGRPIEDLWQYDVLSALSDPKNAPRQKLTDDGEEPEEEKDEEQVEADVSTKLAAIHNQLTNHIFRENEGQAFRKRTIVDDYVDWASSQTDAPVSYHTASIMTILSCVYGEWGRARPQFGPMRLGLFFVIMGETTGSRKSTSRAMMKEMLRAIEQVTGAQYILSSDATPESLIDALAGRPNMSSLYDRDEAQQLIEDIKGGKGYLKGFFETLNELYDGNAHGRLRKDKQTEDTPVNFVQYLMGIRSQIQENLEKRDFVSGWGPRNIWVRGATASAEKRKSTRLKQGNTNDHKKGDVLKYRMVETFQENYEYWSTLKGNSKEDPMFIFFEDDAWERMIDFEEQLHDLLKDHPRYEMLESCIMRLVLNAIKVAILFAMHERRHLVNMQDVINVMHYAVRWVEDLMLVIEGVNESMEARNVNQLVDYIASQGGSVAKAKLLTWATREGIKRRDFDVYLDTMLDMELATVREVKGRVHLELTK